ncbi:MAG: ABC transporter permease [Acidobacteria bacterium]|nr:ABC transporter permease [Acidobacteriota bacterium]
MNDIRFVLRILRRSPGFFLVATLTLGLGIAANTAMFSLFYQVLLRNLPVPNPEQLVVFHSDAPGLPGGMSSDNSETVFSYPMYRRLRDGLNGFQGIAARSGGSVQIGVDGAADRGGAELVTGNFFETLGVRPHLGRLLGPSDDGAPGSNTVVVLSYDYWMKRFGGQSSALNRTVLLNKQAFTVVGVAPPDFRSVLAGDSFDVFLPLSAKILLTPSWNNYEKAGSQFLTILGRLGPGVTRERAQAELQPLFAGVIRDHVAQLNVKSEVMRSRLFAKRAELRPAAQGLNELERQWKSPLVVLLGMASLLLLIACANLANLLAARATNRSREIGMRLALGAARSHILRLLLAESGVLAMAGTAVGVGLAPLLNRALLASLPNDAAGGWVTERLNLPILGFSAALMVVVTVLCGIAPAIQAIRTGLPALGERGAAANRGSAATRKLLVAGQVALSLVLLTSAALFARSLANIMRHEFGLRPERLLTLTLDPGPAGYDADRGLEFHRTLAAKLAALPGVTSVSLAEHGPLSGSTSTTNVALEGYAAKDGEDMDSRIMAVGAGYFRTLGTPLIEGREFDERDRKGGAKTAVVNQAFVKRFLGGRRPVGLHMSIGSGGPLDITIAGVVADVQNASLHQPAAPTFYVPYEQVDGPKNRARVATYFLRGAGGFETLPAAVRAVAARADSGLPYAMHTMDERVRDSIFADRLMAALSTAFGLMALILTAVGLYGVIAYLVTRRTTEIGVRMALGATRADVVRLIVREIAIVVAAGAAAGVAGSIACGRALESQLYGMRAMDPAALIGAPVAIATVAILAAALPALRASRIEPLAALRHE